MQPTHNRILYVDDHEDSRGMMKVSGNVTMKSRRSRQASPGPKPTLHVCMLHTHLPDESGFLCEQIRSPRTCPRIFISTIARKGSADGKLEQSLTSRNLWILMFWK